MKLTEHKKQWIRNRIIKYCNEMNCEVPNWLFLKKSEWQEWADYRKEKLQQNRYRNASNYLGICSRGGKAIAIFVKSFDNTKALDKTIRHELAHWVRSYNHRSEQFAKVMDKIKKGTLTNA